MSQVVSDIRLSVIIPMRNEERFVARCMDSILPQLPPAGAAEVLCIDGASTDRTREIVQQYAARDSRVKLLDNPDLVVPVAMNLGIAQARGEVVLVLGCHAEYAEDYIDQCLEVLARTGADLVGGYMETRPGQDTPVGQAIAAATSSGFGIGGSTFRAIGPEREADTVPFGCFRRDVFERFGLYDERLVRNQDMELSSRIRRGGGRIIISPKIRLVYYNRSTWSGIRQQSFYNGLWNVYTLYIVGRGLRPRHFVPMAFVLTILGLAAVGLAFWAAWLALLGVVGLYTAVALAMAASARGASTPLVLWSFVNLHVAYGVGSVWGIPSGLVRFVLLRKGSRPRAIADRKR